MDGEVAEDIDSFDVCQNTEGESDCQSVLSVLDGFGGNRDKFDSFVYPPAFGRGWNTDVIESDRHLFDVFKGELRGCGNLPFECGGE